MKEAEEEFLQQLKRIKESGSGVVILYGREPLLDCIGKPFDENEYLPSFGYEVVESAPVW